ncbi:MAG: histidine kinase [Psychrosphaera sp.]|nr:histidine kinase [Psychrosphaera sp.]
MRLFSRYRFASIADINTVVNWQVWPFFVAVLAAALIITNRSGHADWLAFMVLLLQLTLTVAPVLVFKGWVGKLQSKPAVICWSLVFIGYPLVMLQHGLVGLADLLAISIEIFVFVWLIEATLLFNRWQQSRQKKTFKFSFTLDHGLFAVSLVFSLVWAAVFTSIDDPMNTAQFEVVIVVERVFNNLFDFLAYWIQIQLSYTMVFACYYFNRHVLVNRIMAEQGLFHYLWITALFILISYPIRSQLVLWLPINNGERTLIASENHNPFDLINGGFALVVMLVSLPVIVALEWAKKGQQMAELEKQNIHTELMLLQQQINPHFLFNTLNNLYALCLTKSAQAPDMVQQLASLLRFVVYKGGQQQVSLTEEVQYLRDYLSLQQVRVSNRCQFDVTLPDNDTDLKLAPLLFVIVLENAFKHGIEPASQDTWLKVKLSRQGNTLMFYCANPVAKSYQPSQAGIGLNNLKRRLALIYPDKHHLKISHEQDVYHVHLSLECQ